MSSRRGFAAMLAQPGMRLAWRSLGSTIWMGSLVVALALSILAAPASAATQRLAAAPANTELPEIVGTAAQGSAVAASTGNWTGEATIAFTFAWQRCDASGGSCANIPGATLQTYAIVAGDIGATLRVAVTATNAEGTVTATSPPSATVASPPSGTPANTAPPAVSGTASQGETLAAGSGTWTGSTPISFAYAWFRCDGDGGDCVPAAPGASSNTHTIMTEDVGRTLRVVVTASNATGSNSAVSLATAVVVSASAPANASPPTISGSAGVRQTVSANSGSWTGAAPIAFAFQWRRCNASGGDCGDISGATGSTYAVTSGDAGHTLRVAVTASNSVGTASAVSAPTVVVETVDVPRNTTAPGISGTPTQGQTLSAGPGTWTGSPSQFDFQWQRCNAAGGGCGDIGGSVGRSYKLTVQDVARRLRVRVTASNSVGRATTFSGLTGVVAPSVPQNIAPPKISGPLQVGATLAASAGTWASYTQIRFYYQWVRCGRQFVFTQCKPIPGASRSRYRLTRTDVGHRLFVQIKAQNSVGPRFLNSAPTGVVTGSGAPAPPPLPQGVVPVTQIVLPNRLVVDRIQFTPRRIRSASDPLVLRVHVSETSGRRPVSGALVKAIGVPFNRLAAVPEVRTGNDGWATIRFRVLPTFSLAQTDLVVVFVRARKPGGSILAGISTRRLVSVRVG